jgi:hypothetical protein
MKHLILLLAAVLTLGGAAPQTRRLVYAFTSYPMAKVGHTVRDIAGPGTGRLTVDLSPAADGGTLVKGTEWYWNALRPRQTVACEVYRGGTMRCNDAPPYPSSAERVLFPLLAAGFFPPSAGGSWKRSYSIAYRKGLFVTDASFAFRTGKTADDSVTFDGSGVLQQLTGRQRKLYARQTVEYDASRSVPVELHDVRGPAPSYGIYSRRGVDLHLITAG